MRRLLSTVLLYFNLFMVISSLIKEKFIRKQYSGELSSYAAILCAITCAQMNDCNGFDVNEQSCTTRTDYQSNAAGQLWQYIKKSYEDSLTALSADNVSTL